jgi:hypothetical protein
MMEFDFGLPTIMKRGRPARNDFHEYINSPEILRNEVFKQWRQMTLSCGHTNLGVFYECAWCKDTKCARCWNTCKRKSVAQSLLSLSVQVAVVDARDLAATEFENKAGDFLSCPPNRPPPSPGALPHELSMDIVDLQNPAPLFKCTSPSPMQIILGGSHSKHKINKLINRSECYIFRYYVRGGRGWQGGGRCGKVMQDYTNPPYP